MTPKFSHPFHNPNTAQNISWNNIPQHTKFKIELLTPFHSIIEEGQYVDGAYLLFFAANSTLTQDSTFLIGFPLKTFERAWNNLPLQFRKSLLPTDNVLFTFTKHNKQNLTIHDHERLASSPEHDMFVQQQLLLLKRFSPKTVLVTNEAETL